MSLKALIRILGSTLPYPRLFQLFAFFGLRKKLPPPGSGNGKLIGARTTSHSLLFRIAAARSPAPTTSPASPPRTTPGFFFA